MATKDGIVLDDSPQMDEPKLGGLSFVYTDVGQAVYKTTAIDCGNAREECEIDGVKYADRQRIYVVAKKGEGMDELTERAQNIRKQYTNSKFLTRVVLFSMPIASITNRTDESKGNSKFAANQGAVRVSALDPKKDIEKQKNAVPSQLITMPSIVDAWARFQGWYQEPLFDPLVLAGIGDTKNRDAKEDTLYCVSTLVEMRKAIWAALGESNWMASSEDLKDSKTDEVLIPATKSEKLRAAIVMYRSGWTGWIEMTNLPNPMPDAFYEATKEVTDDDGNSRFPKKRTRVPAVLRFFRGENDAIEEGKRQLAEREGGEAVEQPKSTSATNGKDYASLYPQLSKTAKEVWTDVNTWLQAFPALAQASALATTKPAQIKLASEYCLEPADVELVKNL